MITKNNDGEWFTPSTITYDVEEYNGFLKETSMNLDIITPVNNFQDYAFVYSKVFIPELDITTHNDIIGLSYGDSYKYLKNDVFPIFKEVYQTHETKTLHMYFEDNDGYVKYLFFEIVFDNNNLLIFINNSTDPLLRSQQEITSESHEPDKFYVYVKDTNNNDYFWGSPIYSLLEM
ncbi:hypothetical protein [Methanobrevibacter sp.]|uniref:hypothetical protein n=1 Tax=Methanobrevibacter sp. TaxID=66852 RepID=UPI003D7E3B43